MPIISKVAPRVIEKEIRVAKYMTRFQCLRENCEDCCCQDWMISLDTPSYRHLQKALQKSTSHQHLLTALVFDPQGAGMTEKSPGYIRMTPENICPFLDEDRLCSIHAEFGEKLLCTQCSIFPRSTLEINNNLEVGGTLACPEIARLALLSPDGLVHGPSQEFILPRHFIGKKIDTTADGIYSSYFDDIRSVLINTLLPTDYPFSTRLVFLANFADRLHDVFQKNNPPTGSSRALAERLMMREISLLHTPEHLKNLAHEFNEFSSSKVQLASFMESILIQRTTLPHSSHYASMVRDTFHSYHHYLDTFEPRPLTDTPSTPNLAIEEIYNRRRDYFQQHFGPLLDFIFRNYALHFCLINPYTEYETLLHYLCMLEVRIAALRFMLMGHPRVTPLFYRPSALPLDEAQPILENAAIEIIQTFTKTIDHSPLFLQAIDSALAAQASHSFARAICLARFY